MNSEKTEAAAREQATASHKLLTKGGKSKSRRPFPECPEYGINTWLMSAARWCRHRGMTPQDTAAKIYGQEATMRRRLKRGEVERAVGKVFSTEMAPTGKRPSKLPTWNTAETERIHQQLGETAANLREASPEKYPEAWHPQEILQRLFPDPDGLLCIGASMFDFKTAPLCDHSELRKKQFVVPAYMTATHGTTQEGKRSMHAKDNTGKRRFIVCDFDDPPPEQHPSIIRHLSLFRPLLMALQSGGKSLHAWFSVSGDDDANSMFWRLCLHLGADPAIKRNRSSFVRLPNGRRDNGNTQKCIYLNFNHTA